MEKLARLDSAYPALRAKLAATLEEFPGATLASPLALGLHPDHVIVASVCRSLEAGGVPTVYFEDLPYASKYPLPEIQRHVERFAKGLVPTRVDVETEIETKIRNIKLYSSQVGPRQVRQVLAHARRISDDGRAYERVWARRSLE